MGVANEYRRVFRTCWFRAGHRAIVKVLAARALDLGAEKLPRSGALVAQQKRSDLLDRLAHAERLSSWPTNELRAALAVIELLDADRPRSRSGVRTVDIRLAIYRRRLQYELDRRTGVIESSGSLDSH